MERVDKSGKFFEYQKVTLEHSVRLRDNAFLAVSEKNLIKSVKYEKSVLLKDLRRIEKTTSTRVGKRVPIEKFVREMELPK